VLYTLIAILLLGILATMFFTQNRINEQEGVTAVSQRVHAVNTYLTSVSADSERAAYIAGFRAFIAMEQHVASTGQYLPDPSSAFLEAFMNGTINGTAYEIMEDATFSEYIHRTGALAAAQHIRINATVVSTKVWQADPWTVLVNYTMRVNASDDLGTSSWHYNEELTGRVPIIDLRDPLFTARTFGRVQRVIRRTNITTFVDDTNDANDTTGLQNHMNESLYLAAGRGPTMLMRFAGNLSDHPYGIESLVDTLELQIQGLDADETASVVDFRYFSGAAADMCDVQNMPITFRIDAAHAQVYQVPGALETDGCP
jgi:hypothetical protein